MLQWETFHLAHVEFTFLTPFLETRPLPLQTKFTVLWRLRFDCEWLTSGAQSLMVGQPRTIGTEPATRGHQNFSVIWSWHTAFSNSRLNLCLPRMEVKIWRTLSMLKLSYRSSNSWGIGLCCGDICHRSQPTHISSAPAHNYPYLHEGRLQSLCK